MATCPDCGKHSTDSDKPISVEQRLVVGQPLGSPEIGGEQFIASTRWILSCRCGWAIVGAVREGSFWADPVQPKGFSSPTGDK